MGCFHTAKCSIPIKPGITDEQVNEWLDDELEGADARLDDEGENCFYDEKARVLHLNAGGSMSYGGSTLMDEAIQDAVDCFASAYVVVTGEYDGDHYEDVLMPPGVAPKDALIAWRRAKIAVLEKEIAELEAA